MKTVGQSRSHLRAAAACLAAWCEVAPSVRASVLRFINALPDDMPCPQIGLDGEGGVMVVWGSALLVTIESTRLHMITAPTTTEARYFDDMPFDGTALPAEVAAAIAEVAGGKEVAG